VPWDSTPTHGWATADPWLPWPPDPATRNAESERADQGSILHLYRRLLAARRDSVALALGTTTLLDAPEGVVAFERTRDGDRRVVVVNFTDAPIEISVPAATVEVASDGVGEGASYSGVVPASGALIVR
jgi:alpha-glucosidase